MRRQNTHNQNNLEQNSIWCSLSNMNVFEQADVHVHVHIYMYIVLFPCNVGSSHWRDHLQAFGIITLSEMIWKGSMYAHVTMYHIQCSFVQCIYMYMYVHEIFTAIYMYNIKYR